MRVIYVDLWVMLEEWIFWDLNYLYCLITLFLINKFVLPVTRFNCDPYLPQLNMECDDAVEEYDRKLIANCNWIAAANSNSNQLLEK